MDRRVLVIATKDRIVIASDSRELLGMAAGIGSAAENGFCLYL
jgi:hypothetical protein